MGSSGVPYRMGCPVCGRLEVPAREKVAERLRLAQPLLVMTRMFWIDDRPAGNMAGIRLLNGLGGN